MLSTTLGVAIAAIAVGQEAGSEGARLERYEYREPHMGTEFLIVLYSTDEAAATLASRAAFDRVEALNAALSDYDPQSELMRLCERSGGPPVPVSDDLFHVLSRALEVAERSGGAFDPTVNPVGRLWRRARRDGKMPAPETLAKARALVDYRNVVLDSDARTVQLLAPGVKLDLGGIAKGYAADSALKVLSDEHKITRALVAAAGDIRVGDPPPNREGWTVAVAPLRADSAAKTPALLLANRAVSTSGDAEQYVEIDGVRYSHIVDPRTGLGVVGRSSATVVAPDATTTDALATALSVLGPSEGRALISEAPGVEFYFVRIEGDTAHVSHSVGWEAIPRVPPDASERRAGPTGSDPRASPRRPRSFEDANLKP